MSRNTLVGSILVGLLLGGCSELATNSGSSSQETSSSSQVAPAVLGRVILSDPTHEATMERSFCQKKGYQVFHTDRALDAVHDLNNTTDVYLRNLFGGEVKLLSKNSAGMAGNGPSRNASISKDGNQIVFESSASDLVSGDTNGVSDIFWMNSGQPDLWMYGSGVLSRVSLTAAGAQLSQPSTWPVVASLANSTVIAFASTGDFTGVGAIKRNIYVREGSSVTLASRSNAGTPANADCDRPAISGDGRYVVYDSIASNLFSGDTDGYHDVARFDRTTSITVRVSQPSGSNVSTGPSSFASISDSGNQVAFVSRASNMVAGDTNNASDIFVRNVSPAFTSRVSISSTTLQANGSSSYPTLSRDGLRVAFTSLATNLVPGNDTNSNYDVFERSVSDPLSLRRASQTVAGVEGSGIPGNLTTPSGYLPSYDLDGQQLSFCSAAGELDWSIGLTAGNATVVYFSKLASKSVSMVGLPASPSIEIANRTVTGAQANNATSGSAISADGRYVAYQSSASNIWTAGQDTNGVSDIFVMDRLSAVVSCATTVNGTTVPEGGSSPSISADGRYVAYVSSSNHGSWVSNDTAAFSDVFVYDRITGSQTCVSRSSAGVVGNANSYAPDISADGRYVTFLSAASNLVSGDSNGRIDVFVYDLQTSTQQLVSKSSTGVLGNGDCLGFPAISSDGRVVAFATVSSNLSAIDSNGGSDCYVYDRNSLLCELVTINQAATAAAGGSNPRLSANGRFVAFSSSASTLVNLDSNAMEDVFVRGRQTAVTERVSVSSSINPNVADGTQCNQPSSKPDISADGLMVSFETMGSCNLVPDDSNGANDLFVRNRATQQTIRADVTLGGSQTVGVVNSGSQKAWPISADGRFVAFPSMAMDLVTPDTNSLPDLFVRSLLFGPVIFNPL